MGLTRTLCCPHGIRVWPQVAAALRDRGLAPQLRMIDGQLALPDEEPTMEWREIRVSISGSMVTLRRHADAIELVTWGNADAGQQAAGEAIAEAILKLGAGPPN